MAGAGTEQTEGAGPLAVPREGANPPPRPINILPSSQVAKLLFYLWLNITHCQALSPVIAGTVRTIITNIFGSQVVGVTLPPAWLHKRWLWFVAVQSVTVQVWLFRWTFVVCLCQPLDKKWDRVLMPASSFSGTITLHYKLISTH